MATFRHGFRDVAEALAATGDFEASGCGVAAPAAVTEPYETAGLD